MKYYYVYILTNKNKTVFYIGITNNLERRIYEHKKKIIKGFTSKYNVNQLLYYEIFSDVYEAIRREKQLKKWRREWKNELISEFNPDWNDLAGDWYK